MSLQNAPSAMAQAPNLASDDLLRHSLTGTLSAAIVYGITVSVFLHTLLLLVINRKNLYNTRTRWFLIAYISTMFMISTVAIVQAFIFLIRRMSGQVADHPQRLIESNEPLTLPFAIWGADGFMLWRCLVIYQSATVFQRTVLYIILCLSALASLVCGMFYYLAPDIEIALDNTMLYVLVPTIALTVTALVNLLLTALIAGRIAIHQEMMRRVLGPQYGSPYMRLINACVESCVLIVVTSVVFVALYAAGDRRSFGASIGPLLILPHICVLSPLLIVYHVARGRAMATLRASHVITPNINLDDEYSEQMIAQAGRHSLKPIQFSNTVVPGEAATRSSSTSLHEHSVLTAADADSRPAVDSLSSGSQV